MIAPIGVLRSDDFEITHQGGEQSLALALREELTSIQYGKAEDRHGWMLRLDA